MEPAIIVDSVTKRYRIIHDKNPSLKNTVLTLRRTTYEEILALDNVSFDVKKGETFGIIGPNGSGKSTVLKLLARIMPPDAGRMVVNGTLSALLELGAGFHPDLTGRENIYLNASILGIDKKTIDKKINEIIEFAGLEKFIDTPIKTYSSGMYVRLGFSVAVHVDPDILLVDEVLAVGDQSFQSRCLERIFDFMRRGKTIVIVSHDLDMISNICSRAIFLNQGRVVKEGPAPEVAREYRSFIEKAELSRKPLTEEERIAFLCQTAERFGSGEARIREVWVEKSDGERVSAVSSGEDARIVVDAEFFEEVEDPIFGIRITNETGVNAYGTNTWLKGLKTGFFSASSRARVSFEQRMALVAGKYYVTAAIGHRDGKRYYDWWTNCATFSVSAMELSEGVANLNSVVTVHRVSEQSRTEVR